MNDFVYPQQVFKLVAQMFGHTKECANDIALYAMSCRCKKTPLMPTLYIVTEES